MDGVEIPAGVAEQAKAQLGNMENAMKQQLNAFRRNQTEGSFYDDVMGKGACSGDLHALSCSLSLAGFYHAVDWSETWLLWLLGFHAIVWLFVILTRRLNEVQMVLLLSIRALRRRPVARSGHALHAPTRARLPVAPVGLVYFAETINRLAGENWESFAGQQYFDARGVFVSVVFSVPLLFAAFFILINALRGAVTLLIEVRGARPAHPADARSPTACGAVLRAAGEGDAVQGRGEEEGEGAEKGAIAETSTLLRVYQERSYISYYITYIKHVPLRTRSLKSPRCPSSSLQSRSPSAIGRASS